MSSTELPQHNLTAGLTGLVLTKNGERLLDKCLSSLAFCDRILVIDSGSVDKTASIAESYGAKIIYREWEGFASQFSFGQLQVTTRWFFILDQDEICPEELARAITTAIESAEHSLSLLQELLCTNSLISSQPQHHKDTPVAFSVGRKSWYFDRFMKHSGWYPDHILRIFRTGFVEFYQDAHIHYRALGSTAHIGDTQAEIIHYPYTSFFHQLEKLNTYAQQGADSLAQSRKKGGLLQGISHGLGRFIRLYFLKAGFLDGKAGFLAACHGSFYAFLKYARALDSSWGAPYNYKDK